jgi:hypothetical protein
MKQERFPQPDAGDEWVLQWTEKAALILPEFNVQLGVGQ